MLLFTVAPGPLWLLPLQALSGIDATVIGMLSPLIIADATAGSGRYNLAQGAVGMATGIGAALTGPRMFHATEDGRSLGR